MQRPLARGWLFQGALSVLYGSSNTGKTFVALSIAGHVATGLPWCGNDVRQGPVLYIAAEGGGALAIAFVRCARLSRK